MVPIEQLVESFGFDLVLIFWILVRLAFSDGPADASRLVLTAPDFVPPAIRYAQVQRTVSSRLHPTGSASLVRAKRCVQPDVDTLNQISGYSHVIVFEKYEVATQIGPQSQIGDLPDQFLSCVITGMRFACEYELDRAVAIAQNSLQARQVAHNERRALVCGESTSETNC